MDYDLVDKLKFKKDLTVFGIELNILHDTISMKSILTTSNPIHLNSEQTRITKQELTLQKNQLW